MNDFPGDGSFVMRGFKNVTVDVPISLEELEREYCRLTNQTYPLQEMIFVRSWMVFRVSCAIIFLLRSITKAPMKLSIIAQGIAARYARRQASSEKASLYAKSFPFIGLLAKKILDEQGVSIPSRTAKL